MAWQGKVLGGVVGFFLGGGPVGALLGAILGHQYDTHADRRERAAADPRATADPHVVQQAYFRAVFEVMGHLAKADGRVSPEEIHAARSIMRDLRLGQRDVELAIDYFTAGKRAEYPLEARLGELRRLTGTRNDLTRMFVHIQMKAALLGGSLDAAGRNVLARVCAALGVSTFELLQIEALLRMQRAGMGSAGVTPQRHDDLRAAYRVLGVDSGASDEAVTLAYRRLMSQNHPDKLVARGLPESMMRVAQEKTAQIRAAYERVREHRRIGGSRP
jgi:DnaJ like chaperone protein